MKFFWFVVSTVTMLRYPCHPLPTVTPTSSTDDVLASAMLNVPVASSIESPADDSRRDTKSSCTLRSCGGRENSDLHNEIGKYFSRFFHAPLDLYQFACRNNPRKCSILNKEASKMRTVTEDWILTSVSAMAVSDLDRCCQTTRVFQPIFGLRTTSLGVQCNVISYNNMYQMALTGTCTPNVSNGCSGKCRQETSTVSLLCFRQGSTQLEFQLFDIPSYCSCKAN